MYLNTYVSKLLGVETNSLGIPINKVGKTQNKQENYWKNESKNNEIENRNLISK